jgi:hypothetical protein
LGVLGAAVVGGGLYVVVVQMRKPVMVTQQVAPQPVAIAPKNPSDREVNQMKRDAEIADTVAKTKQAADNVGGFVSDLFKGLGDASKIVSDGKAFFDSLKLF